MARSPSRFYSTIAAWPLAIANALQARGIDPQPLFEQAGIDARQLAANPDGRVAIERMSQLWQLSEQATQDPAFGLTVADFAQPMHFRALGLVVMTCDTMLQAIEKLAEYHMLVSNTVNIRLVHQPDRVGFVVDPLAEIWTSPMATEAFFATMANLARQLTGQSLVVAAELVRERPQSPAAWQQRFADDVRFGAPTNCLWFDRAGLADARVMGNAQLRQANETEVRRYLQELQALGWRARAEQTLLACLESGEPALADIASQLGLSERSLRRYLAEENTNFRDCLQRVRQDLACRLLQQGVSVAEVAHRTGFSDSSNFSRAFVRWTGQKPGRYRP